MILATKIHFKYGSPSYQNEQDIQSIYLSGEGLEGFYPKEQVYDLSLIHILEITERFTEGLGTRTASYGQ